MSRTAEAARSGVVSRLRIPWGELSFSRISAIYALILLIAAFSIWIPDTFLTSTNLENIASSQALTAILTLGLLFPLAAGAFDLSIGAMLGFTAIFAAYLASKGMAVVPLVVVSLASGLLVGIINGILVVVIGINSFIATLGTSSVLTAGITMVSNDQEIIGLPNAFAKLGQAKVLGIPITVVYLLFIGFLFWYLLEHTPFGRYLFAIGGGREAARLSGVRTSLHLFLAMVLCAFVAAFVGMILAAKDTAGSPDVGPPYLLPAYAAAFLGATQFKPGRVNVAGAIVANYLLATGVTGLQLGGGAFWVTDLFNGLALIIAVAASRYQGRLRLRRFKLRQLRGGPAKDS